MRFYRFLRTFPAEKKKVQKRKMFLNQFEPFFVFFSARLEHFGFFEIFALQGGGMNYWPEGIHIYIYIYISTALNPGPKTATRAENSEIHVLK